MHKIEKCFQDAINASFVSTAVHKLQRNSVETSVLKSENAENAGNAGCNLFNIS